MATLRKLTITPTKPKGAIVLFSIQGRVANFQDGKPITVNIDEDGCYDVVLVCKGNPGDKASVAFAAVSNDCAVYLCTPSDDPTRTAYAKIEVQVPAGQSAWVNASKIAIRCKA